MTRTDVVIVGTGPNGLAAGVVMARAGLKVAMFEASDTIGGGARTKELGPSGVKFDVCSAVHPMAFGSPFFQLFQLNRRVEFATPDVSYAHPLADMPAGVAYKSLGETAQRLGRDGTNWKRLFSPLVRNIDALSEVTTNTLLRVPPHPVVAARLGLRTLEQGSPLWNLRFDESTAPALLSGVNAHSIGAMPSLATAGAGLVLAAHGHARGWPIPIGGSQAIAEALASDIIAHGGTINTNANIKSKADLPAATAYLFDTSARALAGMAGLDLPRRYKQALSRFSYGNAATKLDFVLSEPVPWTDPECRRAGTLHIGGTRPEIAFAEAEVAAGRHPDRPYVLAAQPTLFDSTRAPAGQHILWSYAHVPAGSNEDMIEPIVNQIERFAPGFKDVILHVIQTPAKALEAYNANYIGGDFSAGAVTMAQIIKRPTLSPDPWKTPAKGIYLCSSSTTPGPGVHGMCGFNAARSALKHSFGIAELPQLGV